MKATDFAFWLQGYFELAGDGATLSAEQVECVKKHLALVFYHDIDPAQGGNAAEQQSIHDHGKPGIKPPPGSGILMRC
jgi:hypothetical protein